MIRGYRKIFTALLMITALAMPVLAEDSGEPGIVQEPPAQSEIRQEISADETNTTGEPAEAEAAPADLNEASGREEISAGEGGDAAGDSEAAEGDQSSVGEVNEEDADESSVTGDTDEEKKAEGVKYVFVNGPGFTVEGGIPVYSTGGRYELVSITADRDAGEYKAGDEIPYEEVSQSLFADGTTVTYTFIEVEDEDTHDYSEASSDAEYDGVWDNESGNIT